MILKTFEPKFRFGPLLLSLFILNLPVYSNASNQILNIGFGSCADQKRDQPIWDKISSNNPDLFILMGDTVYIDSNDPKDMQAAYDALARKPNFAKFRKSVPIIATWDDHDFGKGDVGKGFSGKFDSRKAFMKFFTYPEVKKIANQDRGVFHTKWLTLNGKKIQIILLDTRWYRDDWTPSYLTKEQRKTLNLGPYQPTLDPSVTLLGTKQWQWLANEFNKKADLRILISSIQVLTEFSGWETWANFPNERKKLLDLIHHHDKEKLIILSGDIHRAEIANENYEGTEIIEITSSGLAVKTYPEAINKHRIGHAYEHINYGMLTITDSDKDGLSVTGKIYNENGKRQLEVTLGE